MGQESSDSKRELPHGALTEIAKSVRPPVSVQHVREVYLGRRSSRRVEAAIQAYIDKLDRLESVAGKYLPTEAA